MKIDFFKMEISDAKTLKRLIDAYVMSGVARPIVILGPTASGKTKLSLAVAEYLNNRAEIVSADSRQIYKELDICSAKPTKEEMSVFPHHLVNLLKPDQFFSLSDYKRLAQKIIFDICSREKIPIMVGGTGLYLSAIIDDYQLPDAPPNFRLRIELEKKTNEELHDLLFRLNIGAAQRIHRNNRRYVIRAIEIALSKENCALSKNEYRTESLNEEETKKMASGFEGGANTLMLGIEWGREELYRRINQRIEKQLEDGLVNETMTLLNKYPNARQSLSSLGYQEMALYLKGESTFEDAVELFKKNTRNYAKRQLTWFRRYKSVYWVKGSAMPSILAGLKG